MPTRWAGRRSSAYLLADPGPVAVPALAVPRQRARLADRLRTTAAPTSQAVAAGTTNSIAKFIAPASDLGNSALYEAGGLVGVNTTRAADALHVRFTNTGGTMTGFAVQNLGAPRARTSGCSSTTRTAHSASSRASTTSRTNTASTTSLRRNDQFHDRQQLQVPGENNGVVDVSPTDTAGKLIIGPTVGGSTSRHPRRDRRRRRWSGVALFDLTSADVTSCGSGGTERRRERFDVAAGVVRDNAFTGSHYARTDETVERGMLVSLTGKNGRLEDKPGSGNHLRHHEEPARERSRHPGAYLARQNPNAVDLGETANPHLVRPLVTARCGWSRLAGVSSRVITSFRPASRDTP